MRDALLNREPAYLDLDFVLPATAVETAGAIASHYQAGFVLLDAERQIARVVFPQATADFALQMGDSLEADLQRRDFTINAIAYNPHNQTLVDPLKGRVDLEKKLIRMVQVENLLEDPLRLLRAYRQAAQLGFQLESHTHATIRDLTPRLQTVATERIREELGYLCSQPQGIPWLVEVWRDRLLQSSFPDASEAGLQLICRIDEATLVVTHTWPPLLPVLDHPINDRAQGPNAARRTLVATTKLVGLVSTNPQVTKQTLQTMAYSRAEINVVTTLQQCLPQLLTLLATDPPPRRDQFYLFKQAGAIFPALAVLALASGVDLAQVAPLVEAYLDGDSAIAHPPSLLTGHTLITALNLKPGPLIGRILTAVELAQADGKIKTPQEALEFAQIWCEQSSDDLTQGF